VASSRSRSFSARPSFSAPWRYGLAAAAVGIAVLVMLALRSWGVAGDGAPVLLAAVAVGFLFGGPGPGLLALLVSGIVVRDPIILGAGAILGAVCEIFRRAVSKQTLSRPALEGEETVPESPGSALGPAEPSARSQRERGASTSPLKEVTTEATWRFHHDRPLDITLPEDEQIEHLYLYSVLAECNDPFARMYGFRTAGDVVGTRLVVFLPPSNSDNVDYLRSFIRSGYRLEDANSQEIDRYGHTKYFVNNLVGIFERGQLVGAWGTQRDVTDQRRGSTQEYRSRLHSTKSSSQ
jgi:PAS domain